MKSLLPITAICSMLLFSCGSSSSSSKSTFQDPHAKKHQEMHTELYQEEVLTVLDGKWLIAKVFDINIDAAQFEGQVPYLIINVDKELLTGNDGCNSFQGKVKVEKEKMTFGPIAGTLMMCPNMEISGKVTESFSEKELTYSLNDALVLYQDGQEVLVLKREQ